MLYMNNLGTDHGLQYELNILPGFSFFVNFQMKKKNVHSKHCSEGFVWQMKHLKVILCWK